MMRKMMLLSAAGLVSFGVFAQSMTHSAGTTLFGITGGVNWNNINGKNTTSDALNNKLRTGFNGGLNVEFR